MATVPRKSSTTSDEEGILQESGPDDPLFGYHEESSNIQLYYDLFFVANLMSFTSRHEVNDVGSKLFLPPA